MKIRYQICVIILIVLNIWSCASYKEPMKQENRLPAVPVWFEKIKSAPGYFISTAAERSTHLDYAFQRALQRIYADLARELEVRLSGMAVMERTAVNDEIRDQLQFIYRLSTQRALVGVRIIQQEVIRDGFYYHVFLAAGLPQSSVAENLSDLSAHSPEIKQLLEKSEIFQQWKEKPGTLPETHQSRKKIHYTYPDWFIKPEQFSRQRLTVGYANPAFYRENGAAEAIRNGAENYLYFTHNRIHGNVINLLQYNENFIYSGSIREEISRDRMEDLVKSLVPLDTAYLPSMTLVLLGEGEPVRGTMQPLNELPSWTRDIPESKEFYYVVGVSPVYQYEKNSWLEAERDARKKLALYLATELEGKEEFTERMTRGYNRLEVNVLLENARIVARARDEYLFYVLVKLPRNSIG